MEDHKSYKVINTFLLQIVSQVYNRNTLEYDIFFLYLSPSIKNKLKNFKLNL